MGAWGTSQDPTGKSGIRFLADPHGELTSALDLSFDGAAIFGNARSKRYALVVENGKVTQAHVEPDNTGLNGMVHTPLKHGSHARAMYKHPIRLTCEQSALPRRFLEALKSCNDGQVSYFNEWSLDIFVPHSLRSNQPYILKDLVHVRDRRKATALRLTTWSHPQLTRQRAQIRNNDPTTAHPPTFQANTTTTHLSKNMVSKNKNIQQAGFPDGHPL
jgi:hypothetical protein